MRYTPDWFNAKELERWEDKARDLANLDVGRQLTEDYFFIHLKNVPYQERDPMTDKYWKMLGFHDEARLGSLGLKWVERRQADALEHGYGHYVVDRSKLIGKTEDEIHSILHYTMPNIQTTSFEEEGKRLAGKTVTDRFKRNTAHQIAKPAEYLNRSRLVFDIESGGIEESTRIWQLSARQIDEAGNLQNEINFLFDNPYMDLGEYLHPDTKKPLRSAMDFYKLNAKGEIGEMKGFVEGMEQFLDLALDSDLLVGQNVSFDIGMITHGLEGAKSKMSPEMKAKYARFLEKAGGEGVVDTWALARSWFGENIQIDPSLIRAGKHTPYSMENIMLQTNFLERLERDLGTGAAEEINRRLAQGVHAGDVDTWFEAHLERMLLRGFGGEDVGLTGLPPEGRIKVGGEDVRLPTDWRRRRIVESAAVTPYTKMADAEGRRLTGIERLVRRQRTLNPLSETLDPRKAASRAGFFSNWLKEEEILGREGLSAKFRMSQLGRAVEDEAVRMGLPFAGISAPERILTTMLSQMSPSMGGGPARSILGELAGTGLFKSTQAVSDWGRNVALPMDVLIAAEQRGYLDTRFGKAVSGEAVQMARISTVEGRKPGLALVADLFGKVTTEEELQVARGKLGRFQDFLRRVTEEEDLAKQLGLGKSDIETLRKTIPELGDRFIKYGVQIGYLSGSENPMVDSMIKVMHQLDVGLDDPTKPSLVTAVTRGDKRTVSTGAALYDTGLDEPEVQRNILRQAQAARAADETVDALGEDRALRFAAKYAENIPRVDAAQAYKTLRPIFDQVTKKNALIGTGIAGAYYIHRKMKKQDKYDAAMEFEGYETPPPGNRRVNNPPLQTAGLVQGLDTAKIGHHRMGSDKYADLY